MALQIQMPTPMPVDANAPLAGSPPSRSHSPHPGYRPSSRSERLLRDTLRKADLREHSVPPRRRSSVRRKPSDSAPQEADEAWLPRAQSSSPPPPPMPALSRTQTSPSSIHQHRASYSLPSVPIPSPASHEAVLRARLETVLARPQGKHARTRSLAGSPVAPAEWPWSGSPDSTEPLTPPPTPPAHTRGALTPTTPPSPFNARAASQICRQLPGYVSFQDVEGLGEPPSAEDDERADEAAAKDDRRWWLWPWAARARAQSR